jgi:membrane-associated phospholipid phosphatase
MKHRILRISISLFVTLFGLMAGIDVQAAGSIETAGDVLVIALPTAAAGLTLGFRDGQGALELGKSVALTLGVTYGLKFSINEKRPNGDNQSFPSAHTSISFAAMSSCVIVTAGITAYLLTLTQLLWLTAGLSLNSTIHMT